MQTQEVIDNDLLGSIQSDIKNLDIDKVLNSCDKEATQQTLLTLQNEEKQRLIQGLPALLSDGEVIMGHEWDSVNRKWVKHQAIQKILKDFGSGYGVKAKTKTHNL